MSARLLLDALATHGWPALEQAWHGDWLLRAARTPAGAPVTARANAAWLLGSVPDDLDADLAAVVAFSESRGLPATVAASDPALVRELAARGWTRGARGAQVLTGALPAGPAGDPLPMEPDEDWLRLWWQVEARFDVPARAVARALLAAVPEPSGYLTVRRDGDVVAIGRGVVHEGWLGVFSMGVHPAHRWQGHGAAVLAKLLSWGRGDGAERVYLQVADGNRAASGLYASAGLRHHHGYAYLAAHHLTRAAARPVTGPGWPGSGTAWC